MKAFAPALLTLALSACAVGPDYRAPLTDPARIAALEAADYDRSRFEAAWWQQFDDPTLNQLVQRSLQDNRELHVAFNRLRAARAIRDDVANDRLPTVTSRASGEFGKAQQPPTTDERIRQERYDLGLDMAWEVDLFGRIQRQLEASEARIEVAEADYYQLQVSLIAELVDAYGTLRGAQLRESIARENLKNQQDSRSITEQLRDAGVAQRVGRPARRCAPGRHRSQPATTAGAAGARAEPHRYPARPAPGTAADRPVAQTPAGDRQGLAHRQPERTAAPSPGYPGGRAAVGGGHRRGRRGDCRPVPAGQPLRLSRLYRRTWLAAGFVSSPCLGRSAEHQLGGLRSR